MISQGCPILGELSVFSLRYSSYWLGLYGAKMASQQMKMHNILLNLSQVNSEWMCVCVVSTLHHNWDIFILTKFAANPKFKFNYLFCIVSGVPTQEAA